MWFHVAGGLSADLKERVMLSQNNVVKNIADVLLQRVRIEGERGEGGGGVAKSSKTWYM